MKELEHSTPTKEKRKSQAPAVLSGMPVQQQQEEEEEEGRIDAKKAGSSNGIWCDDDGGGNSSLSVKRNALPDETSTITTMGTARLPLDQSSGYYYHGSSSMASTPEALVVSSSTTTRTRRSSSVKSSISSSLRSSYNNNNNKSHDGSGGGGAVCGSLVLGSEQLEINSRTKAPGTVVMTGRGGGRVPESANKLTRRQSLRLCNEFTIDKLRFDRLGGRLVGRDDEIAKLLGAYDDMFPSSSSSSSSISSSSLSFKNKRRRQHCSNDKRKLVLIAGGAGTGKTVLAKTLQPRVQKARGFCLTGKYSQPQQQQQQQKNNDESELLPAAALSSSSSDQPYAGIASCCQELCEQVIAYCSYEHEEEDLPTHHHHQSFPTREELQATIHKELDLSELNTLISNFPSLMPIIGITNNSSGTSTTINNNKNSNSNNTQHYDVTTNNKAGYLEAKHSLNYAFRRFMRVMSHLAPIVFIIDDLQWADQGSLDLLSVLLKDCTTSTSSSPSNDPEQPIQDTTTAAATTTTSNKAPDDVSAAAQATTTTTTTTGTRSGSSGGILMVGTYRNEEEQGVHRDGLLIPLIDGLSDHIHYRNNNGFCNGFEDKKDKWGTSMLSMQTITIGNLSLDATLQLLIELLSSDQEDKRLRPLAECVYRKTQGNAFFIVQFLTTLHSQNLLRFNYGLFEWRWEISEIDNGTVATDNVVDLMSNKLRNLPPLIRGSLALAACFGATFRVDLFEIVVERLGPKLLDIMSDDLREETNDKMEEESTKKRSNDHEVLSAKGDQQQKQSAIILERCNAEGLIEPLGNGTYRWIHDNIQEAALGISRRAELGKLQYELGCALLERVDAMNNNSTKFLERDIFVLANLFRQGSQHIRDDDNLLRLRIAKLNLTAGERAIESSAFGQAAGLLEDGISLLPPDSWLTSYSLCLKLYSTAAEAHYCVGDMERTHEYCKIVLRETEGKPLMDRRRASDTQISAMMAEGRHADATNLILVILETLGVRLPKLALDIKGISKLLMTQMKTKKIIAKLESSPLIQDEMESWTMFLLFQLVVNTYQTGSKLLPLAIVKGLEYILKKGVSDVAPSIVATVGFVMAAFLNDPEGGKLYGDQASALLARVKSKNYEARSCSVLGYFVMHWSSPAADCMKMLLKSYHSGMVVGDTEWAMWSIFAYLEISYNTGGSLSALGQDCKVFAGEMKQFKQQKILGQLEILWQSILNLMGESQDPLKIKGDIMDEDKVTQELDKLDEHDQVWHINLRRNQVQLAVILGDYQRAMKFIEEEGFDRNALEKASPGYFPIVTMYFHCMLAAASLARETKKKKYHKMAEKFAKQIKSWSKKGNPNVLHHAALSKAELLDLKGKSASAGAWFAQSIMVAGRRGLCHDRAMAHERFGDFLLRQNDHTEAKYHYYEAITLHHEWGATAKVDQIKKNHVALLSPPNEIEVDDSGRLLEDSMDL